MNFWKLGILLNLLLFKNIYGINKTEAANKNHPHRDLPIIEKTGAIWLKTKTELDQGFIHYVIAAYVLDGALAFLPATFENKFVDDYGAMSSLDATLRFHINNWRIDEWCLHEAHTEAAGDGRTYSVGRLYKEDGTLIASMQQMCIARPKPPPPQQQ